MTSRQDAGGSTWRADIDGLRAVAILAVVAYHFFPAAWQGGFIGVDVFFVISGYLITRILLASMDAGRFSIASFYARRIRRIFPALVLVLGAVMLAASLLLYEDERAAVGRHVVGGAAFVSNLVLWREAGYFDAAIESKPLAHLWSLGVEEQFYIVWPLVLWATLRRGATLAAVLALVAASLLAGIWIVQREQATAFYLPVFRFWELLAGGALVLLERRGSPAWQQRHASALSGAGFALLALGFLCIHSGLRFPGAWALLPVCGTCLVIAAGPHASMNRRLLANRAMVWIGLISFPLYLWHWPVLALARITFNAEPDWRGMLLLAAVSLVLSALTWRLLEAPVRAPGHGRRKVAVLATAMLAAAGCGFALQRGAGMLSPAIESARYVPQRPAAGLGTHPVLRGECGIDDPVQRAMVLHCLRDGREPARLALVGDSKAEALYEGLVDTSLPSSRWLFIGGSLAHSSVVPVLSEDRAFRRHQPPSVLALESIARNAHIDTVAIAVATRALFELPRDDSIADLPRAADPAAAREGLKRFVAGLLAAGKRVVLVVDNPTLPDVRKCLSGPRVRPPAALASWFSVRQEVSCGVALQDHLELSARYRALLEEVRRQAPDRIAIFDTLPLLCEKTAGRCGMIDDGGVLYSYSDHISLHAARKIGAALNQQLARP